jgi:uncharacterized repeat protein (TIGR01451 family)
MNERQSNWKQLMGRAPRAIALPAAILSLLAIVALSVALFHAAPASAAGGLTVEIVTGYNLVVDSNAMSPSTYAPDVATVMGRFCNTNSSTTLYGVQGFIGDYVDGTGVNDKPGIYPSRDSSTFGAGHPLLSSGLYAFRHVGGSIGVADASRYIGDLAPGQCRVQYWHFQYPQCKNELVSGQWTWKNPPCTTTATWGDSVKPDDDLSLTFDIWAKDNAGAANDNKSWTMTMRNEISAMANKIEPNPDGYWFSFKTGSIEPGDVITSNGVKYEFGRINQGFDNDHDYVPDYNAWAQPIGDPTYDPSCFRLIRTTTVLTVTRSSGNPDMIRTFTDQLYFTNLPDDNTGVRGTIHYIFQALTGPCSTALSPYQEVASGFDNEKFNGDYGTAIPPITSQAPKVNIDKTGNATVARPGTITYNIPFQNTGATAAGMTLTSGWPVYNPVVISDTVPNGLQYVTTSASAFLNFTPNSGVTIRYSTNSGTTWSTTDPGNVTSTWPNSKVIIQWWLKNPLPAGSAGNYATYQAAVPGGYANPTVENCADGSLGGGTPFDRACFTTLIQGTGEIGNRVWKDENRNGAQDTGDQQRHPVPVLGQERQRPARRWRRADRHAELRHRRRRRRHEPQLHQL